MTRLAITVALRDGEAPSSLLSRLARANGEETMRAFAFHVGLDAQAVLRGDPLALARFADLAGCGADALASWAPVAVVGKVRLRGESLGAGKVLRCGRILACPWCIAQDIADETLEIGLRPWIRTTWLIQWIRTCGRHQQSLVEVAATDKPQLLHDASALLVPQLPKLAALAARSRSRPPSSLEAYIEGRLEGTATAMASLVDPMPLYAVARLSERIGAVRLAGPRVRLEAFDEDDLYEAGHLGFEVLAGGAERLRAMLSDLQGAFHDGSADWGLRILFGALHDFVASSRDPAFDSVRNIIHEHIVETMPVGPGEIVLGRRVKVRRLHSIRSASLEHGVDPRRLRKYLRRQGILSPSQDHLTDERTVFPAMEADEVLRRYEEGVSLREAGRHLNAPRPHERLLLEAGYIRPLETGAPPGKLHTRRFPRSALDEFLRRLSAKAGPDFQGSQDIPSAAKRTTRSAMEIVTLLLEGRLDRVGVDPNARGYLSVKVDVDEVRTHLPRDAPEGMTLREAEKTLSTTTSVVRALVQGGLLPTRSVRNAVNRNVQTIVASEDLADFQARYVSLTTLARELKVHFRKLPILLAQNGIHPDPAFAAVPATFYRRQDLGQLHLS